MAETQMSSVEVIDIKPEDTIRRRKMKPSELMQQEDWGKLKDVPRTEMMGKICKLVIRFWGEMMGNVISYTATSAYDAAADSTQAAVIRLSKACCDSIEDDQQIPTPTVTTIQ